MGEFEELLSIGDPAALDLDRLWQPRGERDFLRIPIGRNDRGEPVVLDLKGRSRLGMGPHVLCAGTYGSGKSQLLHTIVLALAATHPPEEVAVVPADFMGGTSFDPLAGLPHIAGLMTNLAEGEGLTRRACETLTDEVRRRQAVLRDAGDVADIGRYRELRSTTRPDLPPLPHLFVVVDDFCQLLTADPDFLGPLSSIGRVGGSLGMHLLLADRRFETGRYRELAPFLSCRIGLRTDFPEQSSDILGTTDAFHLPRQPGLGYLRTDSGRYERFRASFAARPLSTGSTGPVFPFGDPEPTVLSVMVEQLRRAAGPVHRLRPPSDRRGA